MSSACLASTSRPTPVRVSAWPPRLWTCSGQFIGDDPAKGFEYIYLDDESLHAVQAKAPGSVVTKPVQAADGSVHNVISDIIGKPQTAWVSSVSRAVVSLPARRAAPGTRSFTATIVTGRSVGIGAYLARLGERVIQVEGSPLILTGYQALNKLLGREVYTSNLQLGGPQIMYKNGVSHLTAQDDLDAVKAFVNWMSYVPAQRGGPLPIMPTADTWDRAVTYQPPRGPYDPRWLINGKREDDGTKLTGLFDEGSFVETLGGWATSVVTGRARLGGIPVGVIAVETRTLERVVPADPANPNSTEQRIMEAGQGGTRTRRTRRRRPSGTLTRRAAPSSWPTGEASRRTARHVRRDPQAGLQDCRRSVFVQAARVCAHSAHGRAAWWLVVVVDSAINDNGLIEMSADVNSARGGVLEASGLVEIKYRADKQRATMERLDSVYAKLSKEAAEATDFTTAQTTARKALAEREKQLAPIFTAIATEYADAHDRAGRMLATGVLRSALPWESARRYFYWRLRRRITEVAAERTIAEANPLLKHVERVAALRQFVGAAASDNDKEVAEHMEAAAGQLLTATKQLKAQYILAQISTLDPELKAQLAASLQ